MNDSKINVNHILYATDLSDDARHAFDYSLAIARQFDAKITILHVIREELRDLLIFDANMERLASMEKRFSIENEHLQNTRQALIEKVRSEYGWDMTERDDIVVEKGNPVKIIIRIADERECDLIVMGKTGRAAWEDTKLGGTTRHVLNQAKQPVLVVQCPAESQPEGE